MVRTQSDALLKRARKVIPGGVNSPVRAFKAVGGKPHFIEGGAGAYIYDADGNKLLDCVGSWGPMLFGHRPPEVIHALANQLAYGLSFGAPTHLEIELCEMIREFVPSMQLVRLVNSGTEACMSAIRLARGATGRAKIVKFEGCYHGHADCLLAKAGSGVATLGLPDSAGVPPSLTADTLTVPYNDLPALQALFDSIGSEIACAIVEPVAGNMGCVPPAEGFLEGLRSITKQHGALLIFDEVMTGFRVALGGAQDHYKIVPDITCLGKIIGGGLPLAAYGGREEIMNHIAPVGTVYQAGTLSGNPMAVTAGLATLKRIKAEKDVYVRLEVKGAYVAEELRLAARAAGVAATVNQAGSMLTIFFTGSPVTDYASAKTSNTERFAVYFQEMLAGNIYLPPSQFEAAFLSDAMGDEEITMLVKAARGALHAVAAATGH
jgi:glutamate-1-semialdehyde 2,1-aminomutase